MQDLQQLQNMGHTDHPNTDADPRNFSPSANGGFDLNKVDYDWIEKTSNIKELKAAFDALEQDGYFPDLLKTCGERILQLKPSDSTFKLRFLGAPKMSAAEEKAVTDDLAGFLDDMNKLDKQLKQGAPDPNENQENK